MKIKKVWYDSRGKPPGWCAEYADDAGRVVDDSEKVWHPLMPDGPHEGHIARAIARAYARQLGGGES